MFDASPNLEKTPEIALSEAMPPSVKRAQQGRISKKAYPIVEASDINTKQIFLTGERRARRA